MTVHEEGAPPCPFAVEIDWHSAGNERKTLHYRPKNKQNPVQIKPKLHVLTAREYQNRSRACDGKVEHFHRFVALHDPRRETGEREPMLFSVGVVVHEQ